MTIIARLVQDRWRVPHRGRPIAHYGRMLFSAQQLAEMVPLDEIPTVLADFRRRERAGGRLTVKESYYRHELQKKAAYLYGLLVGGCYCEECWEQGHSWEVQNERA